MTVNENIKKSIAIIAVPSILTLLFIAGIFVEEVELTDEILYFDILCGNCSVLLCTKQ